MKDLSTNLRAYMDGELTADQARAVEEALRRNSSLREEFDQMRRISATLREGAAVPAATGLDRTLETLRVAKKQKPFYLRYGPAFGIGLACTLALFIVTRMNPREPAFNDDTPAPVGKSPQARLHHADAVRRRAEKAAVLNGLTGTRAASGPSAENDLRKEQYRSAGAMLAEQSARQNQLVKSCEVRLSVQDGMEAVQRAASLAKSLGGSVRNLRVSGDKGRGLNGTLTMEIPAAKYEQAVAGLQGLGRQTSISTSVQDVTDLIAGDDSQIRKMESELQSVKSQPGRIYKDDTSNGRLLKKQQYIASKTAEIDRLRSKVGVATITIAIDQPPSPTR